VQGVFDGPTQKKMLPTSLKGIWSGVFFFQLLSFSLMVVFFFWVRKRINNNLRYACFGLGLVLGS
jgi:hypothetical protein